MWIRCLAQGTNIALGSDLNQRLPGHKYGTLSAELRCYPKWKFNPCPDEPRFIIFWKHCRCTSAGFWQSYLIRVNYVFNSNWKQVQTIVTGMLQGNRIKIGWEGDKNYTCPLVITSEIYKGQVILPKSLVLQDECFGKNYSRKSYTILLPYVLYCIRF